MKTIFTNALLAFLISVILQPGFADENIISDTASIADLQVDLLLPASLKSGTAHAHDFGHHDWMASPFHRFGNKNKKKSFVSEKQFHLRNKRHHRSQEKIEEAQRMSQELKSTMNKRKSMSSQHKTSSSD